MTAEIKKTIHLHEIDCGVTETDWLKKILVVSRNADYNKMIFDNVVTDNKRILIEVATLEHGYYLNSIIQGSCFINGSTAAPDRNILFNAVDVVIVTNVILTNRIKIQKKFSSFYYTVPQRNHVMTTKKLAYLEEDATVRFFIDKSLMKHAISNLKALGRK